MHSSLLFNARSLKNKLPCFHNLIYSSHHQFSFVFVSESWLDASVTDSMLDPSHIYQIFRHDRSNRVGGGVCALVANTIRCVKLSLTTANTDLLIHSDCDLLCLDVFLSGVKQRIILVYRPPSSSFNREDLLPKTNSLIKLLSNLIDSHNTTFILGDFNLPKIDWSTHVCAVDGVHNIIHELLKQLRFYSIC